MTGKKKTAGRIGNTAKGFDAACRLKRPGPSARFIARGDRTQDRAATDTYY